MSRITSSFGVLLFLVVTYTPMATAQMIRTATPFTRVNSSFYERIGIDFGFDFRGSPGNPFNDRARGVFGWAPGGRFLPNVTFSQGSANSAIPPFGGYDPNADATFGYHARNSNGGYHLGFRLGKGSNRTLTNTTPVVVTQNGANGSVFSGSLNPFVTGLVPIVGSEIRNPVPTAVPPQVVHPLEMKLRQLYLEKQAGIASSSLNPSDNRFDGPGNKQSEDSMRSGQAVSRPASSSTANLGDLSVAEIRRLRQAKILAEESAQKSENDQKVQSLLQKSKQALIKGSPGAARSYLRTALRYADERQQQSIEKQLKDLAEKR